MAPISPPAALLRLAAAGVLAMLFLAPGVAADSGFPLGQAVRSKAVCQAQSVSDDPAAQIPFAKAWAITCRGWEGITLGHLYLFPDSTGVASAAAAPDIWRKTLAERATCGAFAPSAIPGLRSAEHAVCTPVGGKPLYSVYVAGTARGLAIAEGFEPIDELVQVGLQVVAGVAAPPASAQAQTASAFGAAGSGSLSDAAATAQLEPGWLRQRAHIENQSWRFADAERDFRRLSSDPAFARNDKASRRDRAFIEMNWALNISNEGRFAEADAMFLAVSTKFADIHDAEFDMVGFNYRALHALNQRNFADARKFAEQALAVRAGRTVSGDARADDAAPSLATADGSPVIGEDLAASLNRLPNIGGFRTAALTPEQRLQLLRAQAHYVIGCAQIGAGNAAGGRASLERALAALGKQNAVWLRAQVTLPLARLDLAERHPERAQQRLTQMAAIFQGQRNLSASPAEAGLYMELARAEAAANQTDRALEDYATGMELFRQTRGTLGYAADDAAPYLDLLIARAHADPASALRYQSLFFDAAQSVVSLTTSRTVARLAARVGQGDSGSAALARNLDDAQRELTVKTARAQHMLVTPGYADKQRADDEAELARLGNEVRSLQQQLLAANPRYGQLVASAATLADLQKALNPGEIYVKTVLLARGGYVIAITPATVDIYSIPLSRAQADAAVLRLRHPFDARSTLPRFDVVAAHDLFATVFGPVIGKVAAARSLIYEPDGALVSLPAAVFVVDAASVDAYKGHVADFQKNREIDLYEGIAWLGRDRDVSLSVSATGFLQSRNFPVSRAARVFVGFGAPVVRDPRDPNLFALTTQGREGAALAACDQVRLKMVRALGRPIRGIDQTIREIGAGLGAGPDDIVLGAAFTDTGMQQDRDLANYRIVFFGTHGLLPGSEACLPEPALVTSLGIGGAVQSDALLDTSEILDLKLDAELVVLSACDTGGAGSAEADRTGLTGSGEALGGLARDFIYAGGRGLIVSQWEVDTNATLQLMKQLFQPGAASQGDALRRAERTLMDSRDFSHPFYWAGFSLVGDGARAMPTGQGK